jgi:hypothetical protein
VSVVSDQNVEVVRKALEHFAATDEFLLIAPDMLTVRQCDGQPG